MCPPASNINPGMDAGSEPQVHLRPEEHRAREADEQLLALEEGGCEGLHGREAV